MVPDHNMEQRDAKDDSSKGSSGAEALHGLKVKSKKKTVIIFAAVFAVVVLVVLAVLAYTLHWFSPEEELTEEIATTDGYFAQLDTTEEQVGPVSPISGVACETFNRRPFGVMMASDAVTRSYSAGFWDADLVVEQKASSGAGIPRLMAVFICGSPKEIGSIRSAREQYLPFAQALDAVLVHWGGEHDILDILQSHAWDDIDALGRGAGTAFYRRSEISKPHNGFASTEGVLKAMKELGFRAESELAPFAHKSAPAVGERGKAGELFIPYSGANAVTYTYDPEKNVYWRTWGANKHIDVNTDEQIAPVNVVVMHAKSEPWYGQYNKVYIDGERGDAEFHFNGRMVKGTWEHTKESEAGGAKLEFKDAKGAAIEFVPGQIWINVIDPSEVAEWNEL